MKHLGIVLAGAYVAVSAYLLFTQGIFGESFIAIILGMPWSFGLAFFEFFNASGAVAYILALAPLVLNAWILYMIGHRIGNRGTTSGESA